MDLILVFLIHAHAHVCLLKKKKGAEQWLTGKVKFKIPELRTGTNKLQ